MSSLRQKCENAFLAVIANAGLFTGNRYVSQENSGTKRSLPCVVAIAKPNRHFPLTGSGQSAGNQRVIVHLLIQSTAAVSTDDATPEETHGDNYDAVRDSVIVDDLVSQLSAAQDDFTVIGLNATAPAEFQEENLVLQDVISFELACIEADAT